jgi:hypothetical protein
MKFRIFSFSLLAWILSLLVPNANADGIIGTNLSTFAILGGAGVAINGTGSVITGSVGSYPNVAPTAITGTIPTSFTEPVGTVQIGGGIATSAQGELGTAINGLSGMTPNFPVISTLGTITLGPGVYSAPSGLTLTGGTITLNGGGNANALWVFQVGSSLTAQSSTVINVINTGSGAGVYWVMPAGSAMLDPNVTFEGNILANASITLATNDTDPCGRLLTQTASVTLAGMDVVGAGCTTGLGGSTALLAGSSGLSGGGTLTTSGGTTTVTPAPFQSTGGGGGGGGTPVPEPSTFGLLLAGLLPLGLLALRKLQAGC